MGIRSMVQFTLRVAAFTAIACLSLQAACAIGVQPLTSVQGETQGDRGCHESMPPPPNTPDSSHVCCSGDHFPDALLSAFDTHAPMILDRGFISLTAAFASFSASIDFPASFSPPHELLALRI
jgi:hypothetical protein